MIPSTNADVARLTSGLRLPDFLIIGAAKSGTTTLYEDLRRHSDIFLPDYKEPNAFGSDRIFEKKQLRRYSNLFAKSQPTQLCGEASTYYTNIPVVKGASERAFRLLGGNTRLVYIVRDPVQRTLSHHRFSCGMGGLPLDVNMAVHSHPWLIDFSKYAMQIEPWIETFGRKKVHVILFESYVQNRQREFDSLCTFLGCQSNGIYIDVASIVNRTVDKRRLKGLWLHAANSALYRKWIRPAIMGNSRRSKLSWLYDIVADHRPDILRPATTDTLQFIADSVRDDAWRFAEMTGTDISAWTSISRYPYIESRH